jgi:hypothetical protein
MTRRTRVKKSAARRTARPRNSIFWIKPRTDDAYWADAAQINGQHEEVGETAQNWLDEYLEEKVNPVVSFRVSLLDLIMTFARLRIVHAGSCLQP